MTWCWFCWSLSRAAAGDRRSWAHAAAMPADYAMSARFGDSLLNPGGRSSARKIVERVKLSLIPIISEAASGQAGGEQRPDDQMLLAGPRGSRDKRPDRRAADQQSQPVDDDQ